MINTVMAHTVEDLRSIGAAQWAALGKVQFSVIVLCGQQGAGKTTFAKKIKDMISQATGEIVYIESLAEGVRQRIGSMYGLNAWAEDFKTQSLDRAAYSASTGRELLIRIGEEKRNEDGLFWVRSTLERIDKISQSNSATGAPLIVVIDDVRSEEELMAIQQVWGPSVISVHMENVSTTSRNSQQPREIAAIDLKYSHRIDLWHTWGQHAVSCEGMSHTFTQIFDLMERRLRSLNQTNTSGDSLINYAIQDISAGWQHIEELIAESLKVGGVQ